jgi:hypothetical protein
MSGQTFPNPLPLEIASAYDPPLLHDELLPLLTPEQQRQARGAAEAVVTELKARLQL